MQIKTYSTWHPEQGQYFGVKAENAFGDSFLFGAKYKTEGEAQMDLLLVKDFTLFVSEERAKLLHEAIDEIHHNY